MGVLLLMPQLAEERVLRIQTRLHRWAGEDDDRQFDDLYNLVADPAFLVMAWHRVRGNKGSRTAGVDGQSAREIETEQDVAAFLMDVREQVRSRTFRPLPVRERMIPKANGKLRRLGIPTVADRVVQAALKLVLEPIYEADFRPCSYGFRPNRSAHDAIAEIHHFGSHGYHWVLEADIEACFDRISHAALMDRVRRRIADKRVLALVKAFLKAGILTELGEREETTAGTPQGGILSPLLANVALSVLDDYFAEHWQQTMGSNAQRAQRRRKGLANWRLIRYADDWLAMVAGTRADAEALREQAAEVLAGMGLRLSPAKTMVVHLDDGLDFLGFRIQRRRKRGTTRHYVYTYPAKKAVNTIVGKVRALTNRASYRQLKVLLINVNAVLRGWCNYFRHGVSKRVFSYLAHYTWHRIAHWIRKRHNRLSWTRLQRRVFTDTWQITADGIELFNPGKVPITRYRCRGSKIPTPWAINTG
jgi:RNA-directed DNA polymerase